MVQYIRLLRERVQFGYCYYGS